MAVSLLVFLCWRLTRHSSESVATKELWTPAIQESPSRVVTRPACLAPLTPGTRAAACTSDEDGRSAKDQLHPRNTVDSGYVFYGGEYVESPYVVTLVNDKITINGHIIFQKPLQQPRRPDTRELVDPGRCTISTSAKEFFDGDTRRRPVVDSITEEWQSLRAKHGRSQACDHIEKYISLIPCVEKVEVVNNETEVSVYITLRSGRRAGVGLEEDPRPATDWDAAFRAECESLLYRLQRGDCLFYVSPDERREWNVRLVVSKLPAVVDVLRGNQSQDTKLDQLLQILSSDPSIQENWRGWGETLVKGFRPSSQLDTRIRNLRGTK